jgi:hypothetical protein
MDITILRALTSADLQSLMKQHINMGWKIKWESYSVHTDRCNMTRYSIIATK